MNCGGRPSREIGIPSRDCEGALTDSRVSVMAAPLLSRLGTVGRAITLGWITLLAAVYLFEHPLLIRIAGSLGASWLPTVRLMLDSLVLAGSGWVVGRLDSAKPMLAAAVFAATLSLRDFGDLVELRVPWLFQLAADALRDPRYWESLFSTAVIQAFLFGCLFAGGLLSRRPPAPLSIK
jgi:hypothetical protein